MGVVYRNNVSAILEIGHGITTRFHQLIHQAIGLGDRPSWIIDELCLHSIPAIREFHAACRRKRMDVQSFAFLFAKSEHALTSFYVSFLANHAVIFGTETLAQFLASAVPKEKPRHDAGQKRTGNRNEYNFGTLVHGFRPFCERSSSRVRFGRTQGGLHSDRLDSP